MKLYGHPKSPNVTAVLAVAHELAIDLEFQEVNLPGGEQKQSAFLRLNPNGKVPVLEDGDFVLWESGAIMQYLASMKPGNSLWPADDRTRADITRWQMWRFGDWGAGGSMVIWENLIKKLLSGGEPDSTLVMKGEELFRNGASVLNNHLNQREFLVGSRPTLADFSVAVPLVYGTAARLPLDNFPKILRWYARIKKIEGWKNTLPL